MEEFEKNTNIQPQPEGTGFQPEAMRDLTRESIYVGSNYNDFMKHYQSNNVKFSILGALLGAYYFLYRKLYLETLIIFIALSTLSSLLYSLNLGYIPSTAISILIYGFSFYPLYFRKMEKKVREINNDVLLEKSGGTSMAGPLILIGLTVLAIAIFIFAFALLIAGLSMFG